MTSRLSSSRNILSTAFDIMCILFLLMFPHYVPLPFYSYALVCFLLITFYQKRKGETLKDLGLKPRGLTFKIALIGIFAGLLWVAFIQWVYVPFIRNVFHDAKEYTEYNFIRNNFATLFFTIAASWVIGGFYEEIVFRGFILRRIEHLVGRRKTAFWIAAFITSILFGLYHVQQGIYSVIPGVVCSILWSYLFKHAGRNLWLPIFAHATYDTVVLIMIYYDLFGRS